MLAIGFLTDHAQQGVDEGFQVLHLRLQFVHSFFHVNALLALVHRASHLGEVTLLIRCCKNRTLMLDGRIFQKARMEGMEPPARIELATSSLPMRCYTAKPRWRDSAHLKGGYNRFAMAKRPKHGLKSTTWSFVSWKQHRPNRSMRPRPSGHGGWLRRSA